MIRLLENSQAAAQDATIFTMAGLVKWNLAGVQRSFARHQGEASDMAHYHINFAHSEWSELTFAHQTLFERLKNSGLVIMLALLMWISKVTVFSSSSLMRLKRLNFPPGALHACLPDMTRPIAHVA